MTTLITITGVLALFLCVGSYLMRSHRSLTLTCAAGVACWALHFAIQEFWTPALLSTIMAMRIAAGVVVVNLGKRAKWQLTVLALSVTAAGSWLTWQGLVSLPSSMAAAWLAYAGFNLRDKALRRALLLGEALWFTNGWLTHSTLAMTASGLGMLINLFMLIKEEYPTLLPSTRKKALNSEVEGYQQQQLR